MIETFSSEKELKDGVFMAENDLSPIPNLLQSLVIEEEKWKQEKGDNNLLLEVSLNEVLYAPLSKAQLKVAFENFSASDLLGVFVRPYSLYFPGQEWVEFYSHPYFQRRKPQLVPETRGTFEKQYWILIDGQKQGPYPTEQLGPSLDEKKMAYTDLISFDNGHNWSKAYEYQGLNRRTKELPKRPLTHETIEKSEVEATLCLTPRGKLEEGGAGGLMALISFIGGKRKKNKNNAELSQSEELLNNESNETYSLFQKIFHLIQNLFLKRKKNVVIAASVLFLFLFAGKKVFMKKEEKTTFGPTIEDTNHPHRPYREEQSIRDRETARTSPPREDVKPQPSFKRSRPFRSIASEEDSSGEHQESAPDRSPSDLESNEDRGDTPVEQDDIREKLSKETIDPVEPEVNELSPVEPPPQAPEE